MRRSLARWAVLTAVAGTMGLLLAGCGSGQQAQTSLTRPSVPGANVDAPDQSLVVRNAVVVFPGPQGYEAGEDAPVEMLIFNESTGPVRLVEAGSDAARSVTVGEPTAQPSPDTEPATPAPPAEIEIPAAGQVSATLTANGLATRLDGTNTLPLELTFDNGVTLTVNVPMDVPLQPVPTS